MKLFTGILIGLSMAFSCLAADITSEHEYLLNNYMGDLAHKVSLGTMFTRMEKKTISMTVDPSANTSERTIGAHTYGLAIPSGAVITRVFYNVLTTFQSATDAGTVALSIEGAGDVLAAVAISDGGNPWDAGFHEGIQTGTAATMIKTTAARYLTATVAVEALTAGKMNIYVEYIVAP